MKVLIINRPKNLWIGGDYIQLEKTAEALVNLGVDIEISETPLISPAIRMREFDIVHTFNFSMEWSKFAIWCGAKWKKKVVASMIYHENDEFVPYDHQQIMLDHTDACIFQTEGEVERVRRHLKLDESKKYIVSNGIDPWWFEKSHEKLEMKDYILTVGRIDETKGQLSAAIVCKKLNIPYVIIGEVTNKDYAQACTSEGAIILPAMGREELKKWYYGAKVYIQPSRAETWGLCVDEAGTQGCPIVLTDHCERTDYPFTRCEYGNEESIEKALIKALKKRKSYAFSKRLKTWDEVGLQVKQIYENILTPTK